MTSRLVVSLGEEDRAAIEKVREEQGLPSLASAVRWMARRGVGIVEGTVETAKKAEDQELAVGTKKAGKKPVEEGKRGRGLSTEELMKLPMSERLKRMGEKT